MNKFLGILTHIFFPNKCLACREPVGYDELFCDECANKVPLINPYICPICQNKRTECSCNFARDFNYFTALIASFYYDGMEKAVGDLKFRNNKFNARKLAYFMAHSFIYSNIDCKIDVIVPVPMYEKTKKKRGYNQSDLIGEWLSKFLNLKLDKDSLKKIKQTKIQHNLSAKERAVNLVGAYSVAETVTSNIVGKNILLVDDVYTTGATINNCALTLLEAGANAVVAIVATKTRLDILQE